MIRRGSAVKLVIASVLGLGVAGAAAYKMGYLNCSSCTKDAATSAAAPVETAAPAVKVAGDGPLTGCAEKSECSEATAKTCCPLAGLAATQAAAAEGAATPAALDAGAEKKECCKTDGTACCKEGGSCPSKTPGECDKSACPSTEGEKAAEPAAQNDQPKGNG